MVLFALRGRGWLQMQEHAAAGVEAARAIFTHVTTRENLQPWQGRLGPCQRLPRSSFTIVKCVTIVARGKTDAFKRPDGCADAGGM